MARRMNYGNVAIIQRAQAQRQVHSFNIKDAEDRSADAEMRRKAKVESNKVDPQKPSHQPLDAEI